ILEELQQMLHDVNPYCEMFRQAGDIVRLNPSLDLQMVITDSRKEDPRRYNTPAASEVAIIMIGAEPLERNIVLQLHEGGLQRISEMHRAYEPLHYVLMFPRGEDGWHPYIPIKESIAFDDDEASTTKKHVSAMNYFAYRLQLGRPGEAVVLHRFGRLFQQWIVDV
ncbi:5702_t:CDS:1, partial [Entrophospora sp. SA101]